jgi:hypothetical protein
MVAENKPEEERHLLTGDKALSGEETDKLSSADLELLGAAQGDPTVKVIRLTPELLKQLAEAAMETKQAFIEQLDTAGGLTQEQAQFVRDLRVAKGCTWRRVAELCYERKDFIDRLGEWGPPSNQLMGIELCERAAKMFNEDPMAEPWN